MASKLLLRSIRPAVVRPTAALPTLAARSYASKPTPDEKASAIIESVPSTSVASKAGIILAGVGASAAAISNEIYVVNEETVILVAFLILATGIGRSIAGPWGAWAQGKVDHIRNTLQESREKHKAAVQERIDSVGDLNDVVSLTKSLFALSKETAQLEAENFTLRQQTALTAEAKAVLDSWVRYEQTVRESEQAALVQTVQSNVLKALADSKTKKDLIAGAVADLEQLVKNKAI